MYPRTLYAVLIASLLCGDMVHAQSVGGRNSSWSPYRTIASVAQASDTPVEPILKPSQYVDCEPCPPEYGEYISDTDLQQMRDPRVRYYSRPVAAQPVFVDPTTGSPFITTQTTNPASNWELLPSDVIWHSYWASSKEPRMSGTVFREMNGEVSLLDVTLGGRASILRYGTRVNNQPYGWELQIEGAGMPRLNLDDDWDLDASDFRFGLPLVYGNDRVQFKLSYYHLSSHLGDEFIERTGAPASSRINYARDGIVLGTSFFPLPAWRWYAEAEWAFYADEGADPWAFQFGVDYAQPGPTGIRGTPFVAVNGHLRQEVDYGGALVAQAGWLWRGHTGRVIRTGVHYHNGKSDQFEFSDEFEHQIGAGLWYDY